jgi:hypothetical protein
LISWRLQSQHLTAPRLAKAADVVSALGAVQAQDYEGAKWSLGLRMDSASEAAIEQAIANHGIVRTWAMRGTLHFLAAGDVRWLNELLAPSIIAGNRRRYRQLELDEADFVASSEVLQKILAGGNALTRPQIAEALEAEGISAQGQRAPYLLQRATFDGLICQGPLDGREPTYVLLSEWIPPYESIPRAEALARLAQRYFSGHGPNTLQDFAWWSGLAVSDARKGLEAIRPTLVRVQADGQELWAGHDWKPGEPEPRAHLLPPFDAYLLGYKDRTLILDPEHTKKVNAGGGMPKPTILLDGKVAGTWKRKVGKKMIQVIVEPFRPLEEGELDALQQAALRYAGFCGLNAEVKILNGNSIS